MIICVTGILHIYSASAQDFQPNIWSVDAGKMSLVVRNPGFCICENKDADQLRGNRESDQRLCFRYPDSTILQLPKYEISSF